MTRILYIIDELGPGGTERRLVQLLKGIDRKAFEPMLVLLTNIVHYREVFDLDIEIIILERRIRKDPKIFMDLQRLCREWRPDIIHAWGSMPATYAGPVAKVRGIKMINAMIADAPVNLTRRQRIRSFFTFPFSDVIQSNSRAGLKAYNVPEDKGNVVYNGFDFSRLEHLRECDEVKRELNLATPLVVGMVAGFRYHKDYDSLLRAALRVLKNRDDVSFLLVGDGPELDRLREKAEGGDRIIFAGRRNDVESIVNIFDIGVLLTDLERHGEGISNSVMEYMALGKPVIATDGGGTPEIVTDGETGFLIPQKSPDLLEERIDYLLDHEDARLSMGMRGRERIKSDFTIDGMIEGHTELYRSLIADT